MAIDLRDQRRRQQGLTFALPRQAPVAPRVPPSAGQSQGQAIDLSRVKPPAPSAPRKDDGGGGWGRGLGYLINNPLTRGALKPLEALDLPRRGVMLGIEQGAMHLPDWAEAAAGLPTFGLGSLMLTVDEDKVRQDERSNWEKFKDPTYGFGQITGETGNKWVDRTVGLAGDILLDPLTYATLGTGTVAGKAGKATHLAKLTDHVKRADAMRALGFAEDALPATLRGVGTMDDVARLGRRGVSGASDAQLRAMGARSQQGLKFQIPFSGRMTPPIPGTDKMARGFNRGLGAVREQANRLPGMERLRRTRHPIGFLGNDLTNAYERITTGQGPGTIEEALEAIEIDNLARRAGGAFRVPASDAVERLSAKLNKMTDAEVAALRRQAEELGEENILTETAALVRRAAADVGVNLPELEAGLYAMPHVLTRDARDAVLELMEVQSPQAKLFKQITGITDDDLLEESGFLMKRRFVAGTEIPVGNGQTITIVTGSVDELNEKLGALLPNFKGKLYETDPGAAWRRYLDGVTKDVAKRKAFRDAADRGFSGIFRQGATPGEVNPYIASDTFIPSNKWEKVVEMPRGERAVVTKQDDLDNLLRQGGRVVESRDIPVQQFTETQPDLSGNRFFTYAEDTKRTKEVSKEIVKAHKVLVKEYDTVGEAARLEIADTLEKITETLVDGVRAGVRASQQEVDFYRKRVEETLFEADGVRRAMQAADQAVAEITDEIATLSKMRYGIERTAKHRTLSRQHAVLSEIQETWAEAVATREALEGQREMLVARIKRDIKDARQEASDVTRRRTEGRERTLSNRVERAKNAARDEEARQHASWTKDRGEVPTKSEAAAAKLVLQENDGANLRRFSQLEEARKHTWRAWHDARSNIDEFRRQIDDIAGKKNPSRDDIALYHRLRERIVEEYNRRDMLYQRASEISGQMASDRDMSRISNALAKVNKRMDYDMDMGARLSRLRETVRAAERELADFNASRTIPAPQPPTPVILSADEVTELERAQKYLESNGNARRWVRSEQQVADAQRLQTAPAELPTPKPDPAVALAQTELESLQKALAMVDPKDKRYKGIAKAIKDREKFIAAQAKRAAKEPPPTPKTGGGMLLTDDRTPAQIRKDARVAEKWMKEHPGVGRNVQNARRTIRELEAKRGQVIQAPTPQRDPFFDQLVRDEQRLVQQRLSEAGLSDSISAEQQVERRIAEQSARQADAESQLGRAGAGREPSMNQPMLEEARGVFETNAAVRQERVALEAARKEQQEVAAELDEVMGALGAQYRENIVDYRAARAEHDTVMERLTDSKGNRLDYKVRDPKAKAPSRTTLAKVEAGTVPAYEAQPLHRTVRDLQAIIEANPTRNDPLMNRMEAVLSTVEQQLDTLTRQTDMPANDAQRLLTAASKGELQPVMKAVLRDGWRQMWDNGDVVISRELEARYHNLVNAMNEPKAMGRLMTAYTNFFKTYATLSPGFHIRNAMSATFMNYTEGVSTRTQMRGLRLWREYANAPDPVQWLRRQPKKVQNAFEATFASGAGGRFFESGVAQAREGAGRLTEAIYSNPITRGSQKIGQNWAEGPVRLSLALDSMDKGFDVIDAMNRITRIHFDYSQVSAFDERAKRFIPFWTFMSRNLPMQMTQMWMKPKVYNRYRSFIRNFSVEPAEYTPEYILDTGGFDTGETTQGWMPGTSEGMPIFLQPDFAHVRLDEEIEKIENVLSGKNPGQLLSDFNPAITAPIEYMTGKNLFTGREYQPDDYRKAGGAVDTAMMPLMALLGQTERGASGDVYYQEKGVDALRSLIPILDRVSRLAPQTVGQDGGDRQAESLLRFLGLPVRTVSDEQRLNVRRGQYYDRLDERDLQRVLAGG